MPKITFFPYSGISVYSSWLLALASEAHKGHSEATVVSRQYKLHIEYLSKYSVCIFH